MSRLKRLLTAAALALSIPLAMAMPAAARTIVVHPGHSIQAAINSANPGDTVLVKPGTYREYLEIAKDRITLKGQHATLKPSHPPSSTLCTSQGELSGICIYGTLSFPPGGGEPTIVRRVRSDRITGLTVSGFPSSGIFGFGTRRLRVDHDRFTSNGEYGVFSLDSVRTRIERSLAWRTKGEAGFYVGDSPSAFALITHNRSLDNHGEGILLRDTRHGRVTQNVIAGNCVGIWVLADAPGPAGRWVITSNRIRANNRACAANTEEGSPAVSGIGILLSGADHVFLSRNLVRDNRKRHASFASGGLVIRRGFSGTAPAHNLVLRNVLLGNSPFDINWNSAGSVFFSRNICRTSRPFGLCVRRAPRFTG